MVILSSTNSSPPIVRRSSLPATENNPSQNQITTTTTMATNMSNSSNTNPIAAHNGKSKHAGVNIGFKTDTDHEGKEKDGQNSERFPRKDSSNFKRGHEDHRRSSRASIRIKNHAKSERRESLASVQSRGNWGSKWEFLLSCVGLSVGIGNVWRFPYLAYANGGGAFLIPYLIMLTLAGKPMYFLELAFGQFAGTGPLSIWSCAPIAKGVGAAMVCVCLIVVIYYNVVMSYALYFIGATLQAELPWNRCDPAWSNGTNCAVRSGQQSKGTNESALKSSSQVFWERKVLEITGGIEDLGGIKWDLTLCLGISWIIVIACLIKGVKTSGKVVYFAATFPYVILISLLIAGLLQEGAMEGVMYFLTPTWNKLLSIQVWQAAASQMFFSLGVTMGGLIMYSSYNDFQHNIFQDAMVVSILDTVTSIISGIVIFSVLGAMAHELGVDVKDVVQKGPGLAFVAYPEALSRLPWPHMWSLLFFLMLFILGLDSEFALLENVLTSLSDEVALLRRHKLKFTVFVGFMCFCCGLPCVTRGGQYVIEILDYYGGSIPLVFIAVSECVAISWIYGYKSFAFDIAFMLNKPLGFYWKVTWKYTSPFILAFIAVYSLVNHKPLAYGGYDFPIWADLIGWCVTILIILQIPAWAIFAVVRQKKGDTLFEKFKLAFRSLETWGPKDSATREEWRLQKHSLSGVSVVSQKAKEPAILNRFEMKSGADNPSFKSENRY